jgi:phosphatidylglycerophosphatase B
LAALALALLCLPIAFSATQGAAATWAYAFTESGGKLGTVCIILLTGYAYTIRVEAVKHKLLTFFKSTIALFIFIGVWAFINEHLTKPLLKEVRPSHAYLLQQTHLTSKIDSLYALTKEQRMHYFHNLVQQTQQQFSTIDKKVLAHWVEEAGYSFPSGHSFNAFLLATIMAFSLYHATNPKLRAWYKVPYLWAVLVAISRVALGAHHPVDVVVGACMGFAVAATFIYFDTTRKLIIPKRNKS